MGYQRRCHVRWEHERYQIQHPWCYLTCRCNSQRWWSNHSNRQKSLLCLWVDCLTCFLRANLLGRNLNSRWFSRCYLPNLDFKKRYRYRWRASSRNSTRSNESFLASRWIIRFHPSPQSRHFRKSLPTMCIRSLGGDVWRSSWRRIKGQRPRRIHQKEKKSQTRYPKTWELHW